MVKDELTAPTRPPLLGSALRVDILLLIQKAGAVYSKEIMQIFDKNLFAVQSQLKQLQKMGVLRCFYAHARMYYDFNPNYYLLPELQALLEKHHRSLPAKRQTRYYLTPHLKKRTNLLGW